MWLSIFKRDEIIWWIFEPRWKSLICVDAFNAWVIIILETFSIFLSFILSNNSSAFWYSFLSFRSFISYPKLKFCRFVINRFIIFSNWWFNNLLNIIFSLLQLKIIETRNSLQLHDHNLIFDLRIIRTPDQWSTFHLTKNIYLHWIINDAKNRTRRLFTGVLPTLSDQSTPSANWSYKKEKSIGSELIYFSGNHIGQRKMATYR